MAAAQLLCEASEWRPRGTNDWPGVARLGPGRVRCQTKVVPREDLSPGPEPAAHPRPEAGGDEGPSSVAGRQSAAVIRAASSPPCSALDRGVPSRLPSWAPLPPFGDPDWGGRGQRLCLESFLLLFFRNLPPSASRQKRLANERPQRQRPAPGWHLGRGALGEPLRRGHGGSQEGGPVVWPGEGGCRVPTGSRGTRGSRPRSAGVCSPGPRVVPPFPRVSRTGCSPSVCRSRCERPGGFACKPADDLRPKPRSGSWELTFRSVGASGRPWPSEGKAPTCEAGSEPLLGRHGWVCAHLHTHTCVHVCTQVHAHACTHKTSAHTQTATLKQLSVRGLGDLEPHPRA